MALSTIKQRQLILIGGGGHCNSVADVASSAGYKILGYVDPNNNASKIGLTWLGDDPDIPTIACTHPEAQFVVTCGQIKSAQLRHRLVDLIENLSLPFAAPIIANDAYIAFFVKADAGTVIMHRATINVNTTIGRHCIINTGAIVEHDCTIGDYCHISTNATINGGCRVGNNVFIGSGAIVANGISICDNAIIGAGATVVKDIIVSGTYVGNPAHKTD